MLDLFVTETDVNSGKTFITAGLAATMQSLGYQTCVYKPVEIGAIEKNGFLQSPNLAHVKNIDPYIKIASSYLLKGNANPYISAEMENIRIDKNLIKKDYENISKEIDCIIAEGTQGLATPIGIDFCESDLIKYLGTPVLIITKPSPDAINQTLLTIRHAEEKGLCVRGVIINNDIETRSELKHLPRLIEEYSNAKILGIVQDFDFKKTDANEIITHILNGIDIESVFNVKIAKLNV